METIKIFKLDNEITIHTNPPIQLKGNLTIFFNTFPRIISKMFRKVNLKENTYVTNGSLKLKLPKGKYELHYLSDKDFYLISI